MKPVQSVGFLAGTRARIKARADRGGERDERGDTLVELLMTLVVLGLAGVALVAAFGTSIAASGEHRQLANLDAVMRSAAEAATAEFQQQPTPLYVSCGDATYYNSKLPPISTNGYTDTITTVTYWNGAVFSPTCVPTSTTPQLLTLEVFHGSYHDSIGFTIDDRGLVGQPTTQLDQPQVTHLTPSVSTQGAVTVTFIGSANGPIGQTYVAEACTDAQMSTGCVTRNAFTTGADITGLTSGANYYVSVVASASGTYSTNSSAAAGPVAATIQIDAPTAVTLGAVTSTSLSVTFTVSDNAPPSQIYTALLCTNAGMTTGCVGPTTVSSPATITGLVVGSTYYATVTASASTGYLAATSSATSGTATTIQLSAPVVTNIAVASGGLAVTFTGSSNAPVGQTYTAALCTNAGMTTGCVTAVISSGGVVTGLVAGASYYGTVTANASTGYLAATSSVSASAVPFITQLSAPTSVTLGHGTLAGSLTVSFTPPANAAAGQTYTTVLCTNSGMTTGCTTAAAITNGGQVSGLTQGTTYFATVTASASPGYLVSPASSASAGLAATTQLSAPTSVTLSAGTTNGSLTVAFSAPANAATGQLYTVTFCTNTGMSTGCVGPTSVTTGTSVSGLTAGTVYFATVTASASPGYLVSAASSASAGLAATTQLSAPTSVTLGHGAIAGSLTISFTAPANAVAGQTYTTVLCTNSGMTTGCTTAAAITNGGQVSGLTQGTPFYATVTASASPGYLVSAASSASAGLAATTQLSAPTSVTLGHGTLAGSLTVSFTAPANAVAGQTYTTVLCTNSGMTTGCTTAAAITNGGQVSGLTQGTTYYATVSASASPGYLVSPASSASAGLAATTQLSAPTSVTLGHGAIAGSLTISFTAPANAVAGQTYTTVLCTNSGMTTGCTTAAAITNGGQVSGLTQGTTYFATVTASASPGYLVSAASSASAGLAATTQLSAPTSVTLSAGTTNGSLTVAFSAPANAATGQLYTVTFCTNTGMSTGCTTAAAITNGGQVTGLTAGTTYYATVTASASAGYLASAASSVSAGATLVTAPVVTAVTTNGSGHLSVTFTGGGSITPTSYTATACLTSAMNTGCVVVLNFTSGVTKISGLTSGVSYWVTITAVAPGGYINNTSAAYGPTLVS